MKTEAPPLDKKSVLRNSNCQKENSRLIVSACHCQKAFLFVCLFVLSVYADYPIYPVLSEIVARILTYLTYQSEGPMVQNRVSPL